MTHVIVSNICRKNLKKKDIVKSHMKNNEKEH